MKNIGLRTVKTAIAILCCALLNLVLKLINSDFASMWYSPFFAAIAAAYSLHPDRKSSLKMAKNRTIGTFIGGFFGIVIILLFDYIVSYIINPNTEVYLLIYYLVVSFLIAIMISITVSMKQPNAVFVVVLTYCSITLGSHALPDIQFAFNRILSTLVGLLISLIINIIHIPHRKDRQKLFICSLDDCLLNQEGELTTFTKYRLNYLLHNDIDLVIATARSEASLHKMFSQVDLKNPIVVMNGSALYDLKTTTYSNVYNFTLDEKYTIDGMLEKLNINSFRYVISKDNKKVNIFFKDLENTGEIFFYESRNNVYFTNFVRGQILREDLICHYTIIDEKNKLEQLIECINNENVLKNLSITFYEFDECKGYWILKLSTKDATKNGQIEFFNKENKEIISFVARKSDLNIVNNSIKSFCTLDADEEIKNSVSYVAKNSIEIMDIMRNVFFKIKR